MNEDQISQIAHEVNRAYCLTLGWTGPEPFRDWWLACGYPEPESLESWVLLVKRAQCEGRLPG